MGPDARARVHKQQLQHAQQQVPSQKMQPKQENEHATRDGSSAGLINVRKSRVEPALIS